MMRVLTVCLALMLGCGDEDRATSRERETPAEPSIPVYEAGEVVRELPVEFEEPQEQTSAEEEQEAAEPTASSPSPARPEPSLTIINLRDDWAPRMFAPAPELGDHGEPPYRSTYVTLADERLDDLPEEVERERYLEVFGIFPTFRVLAERLGQAERHQCHADVDMAWLRILPYVLKGTRINVNADRFRVAAYDRERPVFEAERDALGLDSWEALAEATSRPREFEQFIKDQRRVDVVRATQAHLRCDGLLRGSFVDGVLDEPTSEALGLWQRENMLYAAGSIDEITVRTLRLDSRERDFFAVLRALRERVIDATGVIEDGSASHTWGTVLGRAIDAPELRSTAGHEPREGGAGDWVSPATEAAAEALGWTCPEDFLRSAADGFPHLAAVELPALPGYHGEHIELRAEVHRGDVDYELPRNASGSRATITSRPIVTLFAQEGDHEVAIVQWPTTIGGWSRETARGGTMLKYKESPVGPRIWRDVIAAPAWIPPRTTPVSDLIRYVSRDRVVPNTTLFGPGYRSAFGLAMVVHHRVEENPLGEGDPVYVDEGVRTHGSVSYRSILTGTSHGCHRLHNHLAVRLAGFLVGHRHHVRRGSLSVRHARELQTVHGEVTFRISSRGYAYELTPPVEVNVLEGNVVGRRRTPDRRAHPLRASSPTSAD